MKPLTQADLEAICGGVAEETAQQIAQQLANEIKNLGKTDQNGQA